jgi:hypothetical protein
LLSGSGDHLILTTTGNPEEEGSATDAEQLLFTSAQNTDATDCENFVISILYPIGSSCHIYIIQ